MFSILTSEFKAEIKSPDHLLDKIRNSVISPKPLCEELLFIWEWRDFIKPKLSDRKLENHSFLHSFMIKKESGVAVLRAKKYPQDSGNWLPQEGIKLLKDKVDFAEVGVAETRVEKLCLDGVFHGLYTKYFPQLIGPDKSEVIGSWERLKVVLENLPKRRNNLPKMKLYELPKQMPSLKPVLPSYLEQFQSHENRELVGTKHVEDPEESSFDTEVKENMDVAIFTLQKSTRPWLGRVVSVMPGGKDFLIQWYKSSPVKEPAIPPGEETVLDHVKKGRVEPLTLLPLTLLVDQDGLTLLRWAVEGVHRYRQDAPEQGKGPAGHAGQ